MGEEIKKPRKLKDLEIEEISLVDQPAVPKAKFLIVKRNMEDEMAEEEIISQELAKATTLKDVIGQVQDALKVDGLPDKAAKILEKVVAALEKLDQTYGYGYPAPKKAETEKRGSRFSKENAERIRKIYEIVKELVDQIEALNEEPDAGDKAPWQINPESEYLAKCVELIHEIAQKI